MGQSCLFPLPHGLCSLNSPSQHPARVPQPYSRSTPPCVSSSSGSRHDISLLPSPLTSRAASVYTHLLRYLQWQPRNIPVCGMGQTLGGKCMPLSSSPHPKDTLARLPAFCGLCLGWDRKKKDLHIGLAKRFLKML